MLSLSCRVDTLYILHQVVHDSLKKNYFSLSFNEVLTLLFTIVGIVFAVWQFQKQLRKNREAQYDVNKKNWYLSVIVIPQLEGINAFFKEFIEDVWNDVQVLHGSDNLVLLGQKQAEVKDQINSFFEHLQSLLNSYDIDISRQISDCVMDLEDQAIIILNDACFSVDEFTSNKIRRDLLLYKSRIISILYADIN